MAAAPTSPSSSASQTQLGQIIGLVAIFVVLANAAFYFLSGMYFDDKSATALTPGGIDDAHIRSVRIAFGVFSGCVGLAAVAAALTPRAVAHGVPALAGLASLIAAWSAFGKDLPTVLPMTLLVIGLLLPYLSWRSLDRSRAAWSMLLAMCAVCATVLFFGSPKVRNQLGVGLWIALIIPGLLTVATVALAQLRRDYAER